MTHSTQQAPSLYEQLLALQDTLIRRRVLARRIHEVIADDSYTTVRDTTVIHCSCGEWIDQPNALAQRAFIAHAMTALRRRFGLAA